MDQPSYHDWSGIEFHDTKEIIVGLHSSYSYYETPDIFNIMNQLAERRAILNGKNASIYKSSLDAFIDVKKITYSYTIRKDRLIHGAFASILVLALSIFLIPALLLLREERRDKVLTLMRLNGMKLTGYFLGHLIFWSAIGILQIVIAIIILASFQHPVMMYWPIVLSTLILNTIAASTLCLLFNLLLPTGVIGIFISIIFVITVSLSGIYWYPFISIHNGAFYLIPLVGSSVLISECYYKAAADLPISSILDSSSMKAAFSLQFVNPIIYILLAYYFYHLSDISGSESHKSWYFPLVSLYKYIIKWRSGKVSEDNNISNKEKILSSQDETNETFLSSEIDPSSLSVSADGRPYTPIIDNQDVDSDVKREADYAFKVTSDTHSLILRKVIKTYSDGKTAVSDVSFAIENGLVFGLLGPNGAGKSTLINAMSGVHRHSSGEIIVNGYDMNVNQHEILNNIGYCPQDDIYWSKLTVEQHLLLFLRLKEVDPKDEKERLEQLLALVSLHDKRDLLASKLSGGEKRRLSIAIAFCGKGKVIFLDEPTTGLDPEVRKFVWNIIMGAKKDRLIILTTHSMEEAEVLSDKIAIMAKGNLCCFGTSQHLKSKFGGKTLINISASKDILVHAISAITAIRRDQISLISQGIQSAKLGYSGPKQAIPDLYDSIEELRTKIGFEDWGFDQPR